MGEVITYVLMRIGNKYGTQIVNFTEQLVDKLETELVNDGYLTSNEVTSINNALYQIFPGFFNLGATNTGATNTGAIGAIASNNSNSVLNNPQGLMNELLTDIVTKYSNVSQKFLTGIIDVIQAIGRSNTDSEWTSNAVAGMSQAANLGLGAGAVSGVSASGVPGGYAKGDTNTTPYSEADELNEALRETNSLIYIIFFKNYDCESEYSKQIALISLFTGIKNVIDHYKDYIKEHPYPLISKYLDKMDEILPSINPSDSKNRLSRDQFIAIAAILMIINYMLCYTSGLETTQGWEAAP